MKNEIPPLLFLFFGSCLGILLFIEESLLSVFGLMDSVFFNKTVSLDEIGLEFNWTRISSIVVPGEKVIFFPYVKLSAKRKAIPVTK